MSKLHAIPAKGCLFLLFAMLACSSLAQSASFTAAMSWQGDLVQLVYTLSDSKPLSGDPAPEFPAFRGAKQVSGPVIGSSMKLVNRKGSYEKTWTFSLLPISEQAIQLSGATLTYNGKLLRTRPVRLPAANKSKSGDTFRLNLESSVANPYVGQVIRLDLRLDFRDNVRNFELPPLPEQAGMRIEELAPTSEPKVETRDVDGETWNTAILKSWLLTPLREGSLEVAPLLCELSVESKRNNRRRNRDLFDSFFNDSFGSRYEQKVLHTKAFKLAARALPEGAPSSFQGAIGRFQLQASPDLTSLEAGDALTFTIKLKGRGNLKHLDQPSWSHSQDLERYDTQEEPSLKAALNGYQGSLSFKTLLVPRSPGEQQIDAVEFTYLDPNTSQYKTLRAGPWALAVGGSAQAGTPLLPAIGSTGSRVESYGDDIRFLATLPGALEQRRAPLQRQASFWILFAGLLAIPAMGFALGLWQRGRMDSASDRNRKGAAARALRQLKSRDCGAAGQEQAFRVFFAGRLRTSEAGLVLGSLPQELAARRFPAALSQRLSTHLKQLEYARYGGGDLPLPEEAASLIKDLDATFENGAPS